MLFFFLKLVLLQSTVTEGARILALSTIPSPSHYIFNRALFVELAKRGHEVLVVSPDAEKQSVPNMTTILLEDFYEKMRYGEDFETMTKMSDYAILDEILDFTVDVCSTVLNTKGGQKLLQHPGPFDLILTEATLSECFLGFVPHFGSPPVVGLSGFGIFPPTAWYQGAPEMPSYIVNAMLPYEAQNLGLLEKLNNAVFLSYTLYRYYYQYLYQMTDVGRKFFGNEQPFVGDIVKNMSLILVNLAPGIDDARPLPPSMIPIGGMHVPRYPNPLPQELKAYLDDAKDGFIFFSLGTNLRSADMSPQKRKIFLDAFRQLAPVKILWKWEEESLPDQPENVRIRKWLPQGDLLAHPNMRAFMSHCGRMSTLEAIYRQVPVVGVPFLWDQVTNNRKLERLGVAIGLNYDTITTKGVVEALRQVLYNTSYRDNVRELSAVFRDQPEHPLDRAVFWTEYVLRHGHKTAKIVRPVSVTLSWYEYLLLDVLMLVLVVAVSAAILMLLIVRCIWRTLFGNSKAKRKTQ